MSAPRAGTDRCFSVPRWLAGLGFDWQEGKNKSVCVLMSELEKCVQAGCQNGKPEMRILNQC